VRAWARGRLKPLHLGKRQVQWLRAKAKALDHWPKQKRAIDAYAALQKALGGFTTVAAEQSSCVAPGDAREASRLQDSLRPHKEWLDGLGAAGPGRRGWAPLTHFVQEVANPIRRRRAKGLELQGGLFRHDQGFDNLVALSVVAGLVQRSDYDSLIGKAKAKRSEHRWPTLKDGIEVERKRIRATLESLTSKHKTKRKTRRG
jgi:hypothetical protein